MAIIAHNDIRPDGLRIFYGTAPPGSSSDGTYYLGEVIMAIGSTPGQPSGWRCVAGGAPGNWAEIGQSTEPMTFGPFVGSTTGGQTALSLGWPVDANYIVQAAYVSYGTPAAAGSIQIERDIGSTPVGSGVVQLTAAINLASTANVTYAGTVIGSPSIIIGGQDRLGIVFAGTAANLQALYNCVINVVLARTI